MNPSQTLPRSLSRKRRTALGLVFASVVLGSTLTACGSDPGETTCSDLKDMSVDDRVNLLGDIVEDVGNDSDKKQFDDASDAEKKTVAETLPSVCEGEDDDTKIKDIEGYGD